MTNFFTRPVSDHRRIPLLDVLRGFALFGIMFVNMTWFTGFAVLDGDARAALGTQRVDTAIAWTVHALVDSKFWTLFALLFGIGIGLQLERARAAGAEAQRASQARLARRLTILFVIGALHATLVWFGDIVSLYAVAGFGILLFSARGDRTILAWSIALMLSPIVLYGAWLGAPPPGADRAGHGPFELLAAFGDGRYVDVLRSNWAFLTERWYLAVYSGRFPALLGVFLVGVYAVRRGIVQSVGSWREERESAPSQKCARHPHDSLLRSLFIAGLLVGLPINVLLASFPVDLRPPSVAGLLVRTGAAIGVPALAVAYVSGLALLLRHAAWRRRLAPLLAPFAAAGRLSLTNYVGQSMIGVAIFYGYGLGAWGAFGMAWSVAIIAAIFAAQAAFSALWLLHFEHGPLEWAWRCLTYGRVLPLRRAPLTWTPTPS